MFLRNFDNYQAMKLLRTEINTSFYDASYVPASATFDATTIVADDKLYFRNTDGSFSSQLIEAGTYAYSSSRVVFLTPYVYFIPQTIVLGEGDTPVTYDDYKLSGKSIPNKLIKLSSARTYDSSTHKWILTLVCTYSNDTDSDITIKEWGLYNIRTYKVNTDAVYAESSATVLMYREVLETPVTIAAGSTETLTFKLEIPMINHP